MFASIRFAASAVQQVWRNRRAASRGKRSAMAPAPHHLPNKKKRDERSGNWGDPDEPAKTLFGRLDENRWAIFLDERLENKVVGISAGDARVDFFQFRFRGVAGTGKVAATVGAHSRCVLAAAAHTFDALAERFGAFGFLGARHGREGQGCSQQQERSE